jgi:hypothetical protein
MDHKAIRRIEAKATWIKLSHSFFFRFCYSFSFVLVVIGGATLGIVGATFFLRRDFPSPNHDARSS